MTILTLDIGQKLESNLDRRDVDISGLETVFAKTAAQNMENLITQSL